MITFEDDSVIIATSSMNDGAMGSSQNPGPVDDKHPEGRYKANRDKFVSSLKLNPARVVMLGLIQGNRVATDKEVSTSQCIPDTDAAVWESHPDANPVVAVSHADCIGYAILGPGVLAIGHAGWRGLLGNIVLKTIADIKQAYGVNPADLTVFTSPFIQMCHFEVGADDPEGGVARYEKEEYGRYIMTIDGNPHVDLAGIFREQCVQDMKIPQENVRVSPECTYCSWEKLGGVGYWSARRAKHNGQPTEGRNNITVAAFK